MKQFLRFIAIPLVSLSAYAQEMPIIGYMGVPQKESTVSRYLEMQECGFNTNLAIFDYEKQVLQALRVADSLGMKVIPYCYDYFNKPEKSVPNTDGYASLMAYLVKDEPKIEDLPTVKEKIDGIKKAGATKPCYINLNPYYNVSKGVSYYKEYLNDCVAELDLPFISFDHYPILHGDSIRATWYDNLQMVRDESLKTGKPFWAFVLSTPHLVYTEPTVEQMRLQVNVNLAYGAQAIQYYTYWHPQSKDAHYHDSPIDSLGKKTATYNKVKKVNEELKQVAPLFYQGEITRVEHVDRAFQSATITSSKGAVGSLLTTHEGKKYIVLVNKSLQDKMTVRYRGKKYDVEPAGMLLLRVCKVNCVRPCL